MRPLARAVCSGAPLPQGTPTKTDYQVFGLRQTDRLEVCEEKRALAVQAADDHNTYVDRLVTDLKPKPWWKFWDR